MYSFLEPTEIARSTYYTGADPELQFGGPNQVMGAWGYADNLLLFERQIS